MPRTDFTNGIQHTELLKPWPNFMERRFYPLVVHHDLRIIDPPTRRLDDDRHPKNQAQSAHSLAISIFKEQNSTQVPPLHLARAPVRVYWPSRNFSFRRTNNCTQKTRKLSSNFCFFVTAAFFGFE